MAHDEDVRLEAIDVSCKENYLLTHTESREKQKKAPPSAEERQDGRARDRFCAHPLRRAPDQGPPRGGTRRAREAAARLPSGQDGR